MLLIMKDILEAIILPPGAYVVFLLWVLLLLRKHKVIAGTLLFITVVFLYSLSIPWGANKLISPLETYKALNLTTVKSDFSDVGAIVVLSSGKECATPEYGNDTVNNSTLVRLRYSPPVF